MTLKRNVKRKGIDRKDRVYACVYVVVGMRLREIHSVLTAMDQSWLKYNFLPAVLLAIQTLSSCKLNEIVSEWAVGDA